MIIEFESILFAIGLFAAILIMLELGRRLGVRRRSKIVEGAAAGIGAVEAAVFALLGLLVAFTFQGAAARFDARRQLIIQEVNNIGTAWLRIDVLSPDAQPAMRESFRKYVDSRLKTYQQIADSNVEAMHAELDRTAALQEEIWKRAIAAQNAGAQVVTISLLPALNQMFDIVTTRTWAMQSHPPMIVFAMLAILACVAALLAGHGMSGSKVRSWIHIVGFAAILSGTVFVIFDLEYPRRGLIRVDMFDQVLVDLRESMK